MKKLTNWLFISGIYPKEKWQKLPDKQWTKQSFAHCIVWKRMALREMLMIRGF